MVLEAKQLKIICDYFSNQPVVLRAYLFGSYSRGEAHKNSDIDLLVEYDYDQMKNWEFFQIPIDLQKLLSKRVDVVSAQGLSKYVKPFIDKDKILIFESWKITFTSASQVS